MRRVEAPERVAYSSPNRMISSPLPLQKARTRPMTTAPAISATSKYLVMKLAVDILSGNEYPRETMLESALVDSHNAAMVLMQEHEITDQRE